MSRGFCGKCNSLRKTKEFDESWRRGEPDGVFGLIHILFTRRSDRPICEIEEERRGEDVKHTYGVVHGLAECLTCGWHTESFKNAQANAARHARAKGHHVKGELGISFSYYGQEKPDASEQSS